jgi:hypothetical protein
MRKVRAGLSRHASKITVLTAGCSFERKKKKGARGASFEPTNAVHQIATGCKSE